MKEIEKVNYLKEINFGDIDANSDPNLENYFIDNHYWKRIIEDPIYYIVGKKGTGKSAIYQFLSQESSKYGACFSNRDFGDFPFEKIMGLSDDGFSKPNQYQSIWLHLILDIFIDLVIRNEKSDTYNVYYQELQKYHKTCIGDTVNLHKDSLSRVRKNGGELELSGYGLSASLGSEYSSTQIIGSEDKNISRINSQLWSQLEQYLISRIEDTPFIIQFDRLDDTYNQYSELESYYQLIISLLKVVYRINNNLRIKRIDNVKVIVYIRSDIIKEISKRDSESARWNDFMYQINWAIINQNDWTNAPLMKLVNKRIESSLKKRITFSDLFDKDSIDLRNYDSATGRIGTKQDVFKYIVEKTFHRPRDVIQFCKCIQKEIRDTDDCSCITYRNIKNAEKVYAYWFLHSEIYNEVNPIIKNIEDIFDLLKSMGSRPFSFSSFKKKYDNSIKYNFSMNAEKMVEYLYEIGILLNVNKNRNGLFQYKSIIRNQGKVDKNMKLMIHSGVWVGLNT